MCVSCDVVYWLGLPLCVYLVYWLGYQSVFVSCVLVTVKRLFRVYCCHLFWTVENILTTKLMLICEAM